MRHLSVFICLVALAITLLGCSGTTARQRELMKSDPSTLSDDEMAQREAMLRRMEEERRSGKSRIPGLTIGQIEDMPELPPLPDFITQDSTLADLRLHAWLTAKSEDGWALPSTVDIEDRVTYLMYYWQPRFDVQQARLAKMEHGRATLDHRYQERISQQTAWREEREALDEQWRKRLADDRRRVNEVVE